MPCLSRAPCMQPCVIRDAAGRVLCYGCVEWMSVLLWRTGDIQWLRSPFQDSCKPLDVQGVNTLLCMPCHLSLETCKALFCLCTVCRSG
jgi:hypothetical protein